MYAQALLACPTHSIHLRDNRGELREAAAAFPLPVHGTRDVFHCGYELLSMICKGWICSPVLSGEHASGVMHDDCPSFKSAVVALPLLVQFDIRRPHESA